MQTVDCGIRPDDSGIRPDDSGIRPDADCGMSFTACITAIGRTLLTKSRIHSLLNSLLVLG
jgi:hypothetical protein